MFNLAFILPFHSTALRFIRYFSLGIIFCAALPNLYAATLPNVLGQQNTLVVLVNFQDQPGNKPYTTAAVSASVFGQASDFFYENSYHQTWLAGDVVGWYTLALSSTACDTYAIQQQGKQAASTAGIQLANYQRFVFIFPQNAACGFSGLGDIGASPSNTWINGSIDYKLIAHEIGHNFGLTHAGSLDCGTSTLALAADCTPSLKSHMLDIMGSLSAGHFNAHAKERLGWLNSNNMLTVTSSGSYSMASAEMLDGGIKALKVKRGIDTATGASTWYYLEARKPVGHDSFLATYSNAAQGISFSTTHSGYANQAFQLDMTPGSLDWGDFEDAALTTGNTFIDASASFTTDYVNAGGAGVTVILGGTGNNCISAAPSITMLTAFASAAAGANASYMVEVKNNNSANCASNTVNLAAIVPAGWTANWSLQSFALASGQAETVIMNITSSSSAIAGNYNIPVSVNSAAGTAGTATSYSVTGIINSAPVAINDAVIIASKVAVKVNVLANDNDAEGSKLTVVSVAGAMKGTVSINSDGTVNYTPGKGFKSSDSFSYTISDGNKTASATVTITLQSTRR